MAGHGPHDILSIMQCFVQNNEINVDVIPVKAADLIVTSQSGEKL